MSRPRRDHRVTSNCPCREPPPAAFLGRGFRGERFLWCRAPSSKTQHVLSSPQCVTLKQKLQVFKWTRTSAATLHQPKGSLDSRTEIPNEPHRIYPASTTTSPFQKASNHTISRPQALQRKLEDKRHLHLPEHPCHVHQCNLRCCTTQVVLTKLLRHQTGWPSRKTRQDHLSTPQLFHSKDLPKRLIGGWRQKAVKTGTHTHKE